MKLLHAAQVLFSNLASRCAAGTWHRDEVLFRMADHRQWSGPDSDAAPTSRLRFGPDSDAAPTAIAGTGPQLLVR